MQYKFISYFGFILILLNQNTVISKREIEKETYKIRVNKYNETNNNTLALEKYFDRLFGSPSMYIVSFEYVVPCIISVIIG